MRELKSNIVKQAETLVLNTIQNMSAEGIKQVTSGYQNDYDKLVNEMLNYTIEALMVKEAPKKGGENLIIMEHVLNDLEEQLRLDDINYFINSVFGMEVELNYHHIQWGNLIKHNNHVALLAPRDHGKTFYISNLYSCWKMYRYHKDDPERKYSKFGFLLSNTEKKAQDFLADVKDMIFVNPILKERLYANVRGSWSKGDLKLKNGCKMSAKGFGASIRGYHPTFMICDDILTDDVIYSPTQRAKIHDYFNSVVMNMLVPKGQLIVVGTPFHENDLYSHFKKPEQRKVWKYKEYPAISPKGIPLWENRYSFEDLKRKKQTLGKIIFSREFLCRPMASESSLFPWSTLKKSLEEGYTMVSNREAFPVEIKQVSVGGDFALSANVGADFTVFTVWGIDENEDRWLMYVWRKRGATFNEQIEQIKYINMAFKPDVIVLEHNNFQAIYTQYLQNTDIPVKPHTTGKEKHLKHGVSRLAVTFERGKIRIPYGDDESRKHADAMLGEFNNITFTEKGIQSVGGHDDTVMSCWLGDLGVSFLKQGDFKFEFI